MALIDEVKAVCDRLAPHGWRELLLEVTDQKLDIAKADAAALKAELEKPLDHVRSDIPGFEDFNGTGARGIAAGSPAQSLLYYALASPRVLRDADGALLRAFPTVPEIEAVENFVFAIAPRSLAEIVEASGAPQLSVVVFATEFRPAPDCADGPHADLTFSRTGIARIGTSRPKYLPDMRGFWPEDEDNPHAFRVIPVRFTAWLAAPTKGDRARVMRTGSPNAKENARTFWVPVHKLFDGPECISGVDLTLKCSARFFNIKLQRVLMSVDRADVRTGFPFVIEGDRLAKLEEHSDFGRIAVVPTVQESLVEPAIIDGRPVTYHVPADRNDEVFATYTTPDVEEDDEEIHPFPAYVHARTKVEQDALIDLNDELDVKAVVEKGGYEALLYVDMTGEGWLSVEVPKLAENPKIRASARPAYVLLAAPDFFPSTGQRELTVWAASKEIPAKFRGKIWGSSPEPLSNTRRPANLQLPGSPFDAAEDTITAVVGMGRRGSPPPTTPSVDIVRASTLPDDGAGAFAPGWDVAVDRKGDIRHLAGYGLGSPFPEDAKLCAALSTFWPAVAPDVYRSMSPHQGSFRGTVAPLTDEEIGQTGSLPWDGVTGPKIIRVDGRDTVEIASFLHVDYVAHAVENRFSNRLLSRITIEEYRHRILCALRVHFVLSGGLNIRRARERTLFLSFREVSPGDPELQRAQNDGSHVFRGPVYRVETCYVGPDDPTKPSPENHRLRRMPLKQHNFFFVSPNDPIALRRRAIDPRWGRAAAE